MSLIIILALEPRISYGPFCFICEIHIELHSWSRRSGMAVMKSGSGMFAVNMPFAAVRLSNMRAHLKLDLKKRWLIVMFSDLL